MKENYRLYQVSMTWRFGYKCWNLFGKLRCHRSSCRKALWGGLGVLREFLAVERELLSWLGGPSRFHHALLFEFCLIKCVGCGVGRSRKGYRLFGLIKRFSRWSCLEQWEPKNSCFEFRSLFFDYWVWPEWFGLDFSSIFWTFRFSFNEDERYELAQIYYRVSSKRRSEITSEHLLNLLIPQSQTKTS